jgi:prepilin-type N-terminal cleavage/methylation domain-containing protein
MTKKYGGDAMKNNKGVTLVELLIVITIIGLLAAVGIPTYVGMQDRGARTEGLAKLEELRLLQEQYYAENGQYAPQNPGKNASLTWTYKATPGTLDSGVEDVLPGFQPGGCNKSVDSNCSSPFGLEFIYSITSQDTDGDGLADQFVATAQGAGKKIDSCEIYTKDWQNN